MKEAKYFGTDGIRGSVGKFPITVDFLLKVGWAIGKVLGKKKHPKVVMGKDTRASGYMIESALQAGLSAAGANVYLLGPMPTSGIAYLTRALHADIGIVISASHNPYHHNGVKFFSGTGYKFSHTLEKGVEKYLDKTIETQASEALGKAWRVNDAAKRYIEYCKHRILERIHLEKIKIVVDCANGATFHIAPRVFKDLGASVIPIHVSPNGFNINAKCGSLYPHAVQQQVITHKAHIGIAFDGDGDRVVLVDHLGEIVDGDEILFIIAKYLFQSGKLKGGVVGTFMSNLGLGVALKALKIPFFCAPVGDINVLSALMKKNWLLGGEPSGHIIYLPANQTADGIITALQILAIMAKTRKSLHELKKGMQKFPQEVINLPHHGIHLNLSRPEIAKEIKQIEKNLGEHGRTLLRYSGTEPVIRVMVEGEEQKKVDRCIKKLCAFIQHKIHEDIPI